MYICLLVLCGGFALLGAFPNRSLLGIVGALLVAGSALALLVIFANSIVRSIRLRRVHGQLVAGVILLVLALPIVLRFGGPSSTAKIEQTIGTVATRTDPASCDELMTDRYLEQTTGEEMPYADDVCRSNVGRGVADAIEVSEIAVDGSRATALVANTGGTLDGSEVVVRLVEEGGDWKLDRLVKVADFDRAGFRQAYRRQLFEFGSSGKAVGCVLERESTLSEDEVEHAILAPGEKTFATMFVKCDRDGVEREVMRAITDPRLGVSRRGRECSKQRLAAATSAKLVQTQFSIVAYNRLLLACDKRAFFAYYRRDLTTRTALDPATIECVLDALRGLSTNGVISVTYDQSRYEGQLRKCESRT